MPRERRAKLLLRLASGKGDAQPSRRTWPCGSAGAVDAESAPTATTGRHHRTSSGRDPAGRFNSFGNRCRATLLLRRATRNRRTGVGRSFRFAGRRATVPPHLALWKLPELWTQSARPQLLGKPRTGFPQLPQGVIIGHRLEETQQGASTRSGIGVGRSFRFAWRGKRRRATVPPHLALWKLPELWTQSARPQLLGKPRTGFPQLQQGVIIGHRLEETQQGASTRSGIGVGRSFRFAWRRENAARA